MSIYKPASTLMAASAKLSGTPIKPFADLTKFQQSFGALQYVTMTHPGLSFAIY